MDAKEDFRSKPFFFPVLVVSFLAVLVSHHLGFCLLKLDTEKKKNNNQYQSCIYLFSLPQLFVYFKSQFQIQLKYFRDNNKTIA